ncbi:MAG: ferritin-like domain-containing protein [Thermoleophilia bacterium]
MTMTTSRAGFFSLGAKGGLALVAGGSLLGVAAGPALGQGAGDVDIAKLAATAELLAIDVYGRAIDTGLFEGDVLAYMQAARQNEQDHYDALAGVLGMDAPKDVAFTYPSGTFASAESIAATGVALETAFVGAYIGAVEALQSVELKAVAAQIGANEAQHLTTFKRLEAGGTLVPNPSFPKALTAAQATKAVTPFLA